MRILKISASEVLIPTPRKHSGENRFAFFHGPNGQARASSAYPYCLRLSKVGFPLDGKHGWLGMEYKLVQSIPHERDVLGNLVYILRRGNSCIAGECLCFLDMCPKENGTAVLFSWNRMTSVLGGGLGFCSEVARPKRGGARRACEIEYPVLFCRPGARFEWARCCFHGRHEDFQAEWDGMTFRVIQRPAAVTDLIRHFDLAESSERRQALRWRE